MSSAFRIFGFSVGYSELSSILTSLFFSALNNGLSFIKTPATHGISSENACNSLNPMLNKKTFAQDKGHNLQAYNPNRLFRKDFDNFSPVLRVQNLLAFISTLEQKTDLRQKLKVRTGLVYRRKRHYEDSARFLIQ